MHILFYFFEKKMHIFLHSNLSRAGISTNDQAGFHHSFRYKIYKIKLFETKYANWPIFFSAFDLLKLRIDQQYMNIGDS